LAACRGDFERTARTLLAPHIREIRDVRERFEVVGRRRWLWRIALTTEIGHGFCEVAHTDRRDARECHLRPGLRGTDEVRQSGAPGPFGGNQRPRHRPEPTVERKLADRGMALECLRWQLVGGCEHRERDRQVEARPFLAQRRRREIDGDAPLRGPLELGRRDPATDALLRLLASAVGEPDDRERRQPLLEVRLDLDAARVDADERVGDRACEHVVTLGGKP